MLLLKWVCRLILLLIVLLGLSVYISRKLHGKPKSDWFTWLHNYTCELPCWRGIVPGKTQFRNAYSTLLRMYDVQIGYPNQYLDFPGARVFQLLHSGGITNSIIFISDDDIRANNPVSAFEFDFPHESGLTLDMLIHDVGKPDLFSVIQPVSSTFNVRILFFRKSMYINLMLQTADLLEICKQGFDKFPVPSVGLSNITIRSSEYRAWVGYDGLKNALCPPR